MAHVVVVVGDRVPCPVRCPGVTERAAIRAVIAHERRSQADATIGVLATLTIATLSGFAAVYTEMVLKRGKLVAHGAGGADMLAYMQIYMASASLVTMGAFALVRDAPASYASDAAVAISSGVTGI